MSIITLSQDPAGNLFLHREGAAEVWRVSDRLPDARFQDDVLTLASGQTDAWRLQLRALEYGSAAFKVTQRIVLWLSPNDWDVLAQPNRQALEYLGLPPDYVFAPAYAPARPLGRPPVYLEARQRLTMELPRALMLEIDALALHAGMTRTALVEQALRQYLLRSTLDQPDAVDAAETPTSSAAEET
jgi:hypothetical protein